MKAITFPVIALLLSLLLPAGVVPAQEPTAAGTLSVSGRGEYEVAPEILTFFGSLTHKADTAAAARQPHLDALPRVRAVIDDLVGQGLLVRGSTYSLRSEQPFRFASEEVSAEERERLVYTARTFYRFEIEDLPRAASLISALAAADIELHTFDFSVRGERAALLEARRAAARDALDQAQAYAQALSLELVGIQ